MSAAAYSKDGPFTPGTNETGAQKAASGDLIG